MNRAINLLFLFVFVFSSCNTKTTKSEEEYIAQKPTIRYRLTYDSADKYPRYPNGRNLHYEVDKKYAQEELNVIADSVIKSDNGMHGMISIHWSYMEEYDNENAWKSDLFACSMTRNGEVVTTTEQEMKNRHSKNNGEERKTTIGKWNDYVTKVGLYIVKDKYENYFLQYYYLYFDPLELPIKREKLNGKIVYTVPAHEGGFMSIDKEGILRVYDKATMQNIISFGK